MFGGPIFYHPLGFSNYPLKPMGLKSHRGLPNSLAEWMAKKKSKLFVYH